MSHFHKVSYAHYTVTITLRPWLAGCHWEGSGDRGAGTSPVTTSLGENFLTGGEGLGETRGAGGGVSSCCMAADHSKWTRISHPLIIAQKDLQKLHNQIHLQTKFYPQKQRLSDFFFSTQGYSTYTISAPQLQLVMGEVLHSWEILHT